MCLIENEFKYNWHNAKNSYHSLLFTNAVSSSGASFFLRRVALVNGVLLSSKSLVCLPVCFLRRVALHAVLSVSWLLRRFTLFVELLGLWGCLACGVAWLVER